MAINDPPIYTTLAGYVAALETHGATVDDIPMLVAKLREASDRIRALEDALDSLIDLEPEPSAGAWEDSKEIRNKGAGP